MSDDAELEAFKQSIDLRQYAAFLGYEMDRRDSWRGSTVMRRGADKIVIKRNVNGHYVYFSVRDDRDNGTIIDFVQFRDRATLGAVRKALRPWIGRPSSPALPLFPALEPAGKDRLRVENEYRRMEEAPAHPYLVEERRIPAVVLGSPRFAGRVRIDGRGNAVFPHFDVEGLCGFEVKNHGFTGFASGGEKGLWLSHAGKDDRRLVIAESAIDALSYAGLFPDSEDHTRYGSLGGKPNPKQPELVKAAVARMSAGSHIIAAMDADEAGGQMAEVVRLAVESVGAKSGCADLVFKIHQPGLEGKDWNEALQKRGPSFPVARFDV